MCISEIRNISPTEWGIVSLIRSAVKEEAAILPDMFNWDEARAIIEKSNLYNLTWFGLKQSNIDAPEWLKNSFLQQAAHLTRLWKETETLLEDFRAAEIEYILLKGVDIKEKYPNRLMRSMGDIDILVHEDEYWEKVIPIMISNGFVELNKSGECNYKWKKYGMLFEIHYRIEANPKILPIIGDGWSFLKENNVAIYSLIHFAIHYIYSGIGITHFVDFYFLSDELDEIDLTEYGLTDFKLNVLRTVDAWFNDAPLGTKEKYLTVRLFDFGTFGNEERLLSQNNYSKLKEVDNNVWVARIRDISRRLFLPYKYMKSLYPILEEKPILLPMMWIRRLTMLFLGKKYTKYLSNLLEFKDRANRFKSDVEYIGLKDFL